MQNNISYSIAKTIAGNILPNLSISIDQYIAIIQRYLGRISGPLLDRIDIHIEVTPVSFDQMTASRKTESSSLIREGVTKARCIMHRKSFELGVLIFNYSGYLNDQHRGVCHIKTTTQMWNIDRCDIREADYSESRRDLLHKLSIALKETNETLYWLELLETCNLGDPDTFKEIKDLSIQLLRMLISATRKIKMSL